ncbi:MAG: SCO family protein [Pseudomonadota bacterium]|nr:SCO family protein [Pseudomonadota bacterium]
MNPVITLRALCAILALSATAARAHDVNHQGRPPLSADPSRVPVRIIDRPVVDQDGATAQFSRDVIGDKLVVVDFIYTSCGTLCPLQSSILADLQDKLGSRLGRDVAFVSLSVDPKTDGPDKLKAEAERYAAKPGWRFVTGQPKDIEVILTGMQAWVETPEDHPGFFLVGSAAESTWSKLDGLPSPDLLLERLDQAAHARAHHH